MPTADHLREADIQAQIRLTTRGRSPRPLALHGTGDAGEVHVDGQPWVVVPVRSELELRAALLDADKKPALALLVDYTDRLPLDIACRLLGQRVHTVDRRSRLAHLFGARRVAPGLSGTALADVLLDELPDDLPCIAGTVLQPDDAWRRYLAVRLALPHALVLDVAVLLDHALTRPDDGVAFRGRRDDEPWALLLDEAQGFMERVCGPAAAVLWNAWMTGGIEDLVAWMVHVDAARRAGHDGATDAPLRGAGGVISVLRTALRYAPGVNVGLLSDPVARPLCAALTQALDKADDGRRLGILQRAQELFSDPGFGPARRLSPWLPEGLSALQDDLAGVLADALEGGTPLVRAIALVEQIGAHRLTGLDDTARRRFEVCQAGARLATWMAWLHKRPLPDDVGWSGLGKLAGWYNGDGGWVDWARDEVRGHSTSHEKLDRALATVLVKADDLRRHLDERFANALGAWHDAGKPSVDALPIEDISERIVAGFLGANPDRRMLVVVLDGMSVNVATRLVVGLDEWAPVVWTPERAKAMPPAIAALPTLTATSRAALFAGVTLARFGDEREGADTERWAANMAVQPFAGTSAGPRLFLKGTLTSQGDLHPALRQALNDEAERVVAVVLNAVDDQLGGSDQVSLSYERPQSIPLLERLLRAARDTGRVVLLTSDHGHVSAGTMTGQPRPDGSGGEGPSPVLEVREGRRWRTLGPGQAPQDGEIALPSGCWKPRGSRAVAVLWDEQRCWGSASKGTHGGASLAEAVIPLRLIAHTWMQPAHGLSDDDLRTAQPPSPVWWRLLPPPERAAAASKVTPQLSLLSRDPDAVPVAPKPSVAATDKAHPLTRALENSPLFKQQKKGLDAATVERAIRFIDALAHASGHQLSIDQFARRTGERTRRVSGLVSHTSFLNADGFAILEVDPIGRQVRLHRDRLESQYGIMGVEDGG